MGGEVRIVEHHAGVVNYFKKMTNYHTSSKNECKLEVDKLPISSVVCFLKKRIERMKCAFLKSRRKILGTVQFSHEKLTPCSL